MHSQSLFNPHFLPAHRHCKRELLQPPQRLHYEEIYLIAIQNLSISKHFLNSQVMLPSLTWCRKASCSSILAPLLHCSFRTRRRIPPANLPLSNSALQGKINAFQLCILISPLTHRGRADRVQFSHSTLYSPADSEKRCRCKAGIYHL